MKQNNAYLRVDISIEESKWGFKAEELFSIVIRQNKKRHFLFASTVIGKYIAVHPFRPILISKLLASVFCMEIEGQIPTGLEGLLEAWKVLPGEKQFEQIINNQYLLSKNTLFIGFAETATGLGHGVFSTFKENCAYLHTTRSNISDEKPDLIFAEEHSHAVGHNCFAREIANFEDYERVVLIDDEITTGHTALNLIKAIHENNKNIKEFVVMSILDWREAENIRQFEVLEEMLQIKIHCVCILKGQIKVHRLKEMETIVLNNQDVHWQEKSERTEAYWDNIYLKLDHSVTLETIGNDHMVRQLKYMKKATGRFGLEAHENRQYQNEIKKIGHKLCEYRQYEKCLCLGTEEFIYIPSLMSCYMGEGVSFASAARSPIVTIAEKDSAYEGYALKDALRFKSPEDDTLPIYLYNMVHQPYEEIFWFLERDIEEDFKEKMGEVFYNLGIKKIHFVILS